MHMAMFLQRLLIRSNRAEVRRLQRLDLIRVSGLEMVVPLVPVFTARPRAVARG